MGRRRGSGQLPKYVSFRTSEDRFKRMVAIQKQEGIRSVSSAYRKAEAQFIATYSTSLKTRLKLKLGRAAKSRQGAMRDS